MFIFPVSTPDFVENPPRERISAPSGRNAQLVPAICANFASKSGALIRTQFRSELYLTPEIFLRTLVLYPWRWLAVFFAFCCIAFCKGAFLSNFLPRYFRFSENSFCRKPTRAGILRRVVAVVLSVSLLATKTTVLLRSLVSCIPL